MKEYWKYIFERTKTPAPPPRPESEDDSDEPETGYVPTSVGDHMINFDMTRSGARQVDLPQNTTTNDAREKELQRVRELISTAAERNKERAEQEAEANQSEGGKVMDKYVEPVVATLSGLAGFVRHPAARAFSWIAPTVLAGTNTLQGQGDQAASMGTLAAINAIMGKRLPPGTLVTTRGAVDRARMARLNARVPPGIAAHYPVPAAEPHASATGIKGLIPKVVSFNRANRAGRLRLPGITSNTLRAAALSTYLLSDPLGDAAKSVGSGIYSFFEPPKKPKTQKPPSRPTFTAPEEPTPVVVPPGTVPTSPTGGMGGGRAMGAELGDSAKAQMMLAKADKRLKDLSRHVQYTIESMIVNRGV